MIRAVRWPLAAILLGQQAFGQAVAPPPAGQHGPVIRIVAAPPVLKPPAELTPPAPKPTPAPASTGLTLQYVEELTLRCNPILPRESAKVDAARGQAIQAGLLPNPRWDSNNPWVFAGRNTTMNVGFQQEIPILGKKRLDLAAAGENVRQQQFSFDQTRLAMITAVRQQFYQVLADQRRVSVLTQMVDLTGRALDAGRARKKAGDATEADVLLLDVDHRRVEANLRAAQAILDGDRKQLAALVGVPAVAAYSVAGRIDGGYPEFDEAALIEFVSERHPTIQGARAVVAQNQILVRRAQVEPYPNLTIGPAYQFGVVPGNDQFWLNFSFAVPVWDRNQGNIHAARANLATALETVRSSRNDLLNQAANLLSQYRSARALVAEFEKTILPRSTEAARLVGNGYANRIVDLATYLTAQRAVIQANSDYVDALQNLWLNAAQVAGLLQMEQFPAP
jgi:cobalt-zinc-cadmium efflux system outer membrane protein